MRLSAPHAAVFHAFWRAFSSIVAVFLGVIALALIASHFIARRILRPIRQLPQRLEQHETLPEPPVYPELAPLVQEVLAQRSSREQMRQEFTANVSHELKTPLTTISGYSEMLETGLVKPKDVRTTAGKIKREAQRMQNLVSDIIELSHLDSKSALESPEPVAMLPLVTECLEQLAPAMQKKNIHTSITGGGFTVSGSPRQLWELVYNLLDNACRYNRDGGSIRVTLQGRTLCVADTGIGIPAAHQDRIFERFYRVDKSHSRASGGTGLGLSIVKHVAELHHARITLKSSEHIGTEICVQFPPESPL